MLAGVYNSLCNRPTFQSLASRCNMTGSSGSSTSSGSSSSTLLTLACAWMRSSSEKVRLLRFCRIRQYCVCQSSSKHILCGRRRGSAGQQARSCGRWRRSAGRWPGSPSRQPSPQAGPAAAVKSPRLPLCWIMVVVLVGERPAREKVRIPAALAYRRLILAPVQRPRSMSPSRDGPQNVSE